MKFFSGNTTTLLKNGEAFFPALEAAINAAEREVHIETYIYFADDIGQRVEAALLGALARGVQVRLLVDGIGGKLFVNAHLSRLRKAGIDLLVYRRDRSLFNFARVRLRRLHRKVAVIDGRIAFVGGINIISDYAPPNGENPQYDYAVKIEGPLVPEIHANARRLWRTVSLRTFRRRKRVAADFDAPPAPPRHDDAPVRAAFVFRDNLAHRRDIEQAYMLAIAGAQEEVIIACSYFFPGRSFRQLLKRVARRGVRVQLLLQGHTDHRVLRWATRALYLDLLHNGIVISEYMRSMLHAKVCVVDSRWATVGSSNLDPFSLMLAREANVVIENDDFAQQLRASLQSAINNESETHTLPDWTQRGWLARFASWVAYRFARAVVSVIGVGRG